MVLTGLAVGNVLGGIAADRGRGSLAFSFGFAGAWSVIPIVADRLPEVLLPSLGFVWGALASAATYFLVPAMSMGAVTPLLVARQTNSVTEVGLRFGHVGAAGTTGAILGSVVTGFAALPAFSLGPTLSLISAFFFLCAAFAATLERSRVPAPLFVLFAGTALLLPRAAEDEDIVFSGQSVYASLRVVDNEWYGDVPVRELWQNGSLSSAEHRETGEPTQYYKRTEAWLLSDRLDRIDSVLVLGGAANTLPARLKRWQPDLHITVVEIDPMAVEVAREYFSFGRLEPGSVEVRVGDARPYLRQEERRYDVILADAYDHLYSVPWPLVTREAFASMEGRLKEGGMMALTLSTPLTGPGSRFLERVVATLRTVFRDVRVYLTRSDLDATSTQEVIVVAVRDPGDFPEVASPWIDVPGIGTPLRDDYAPVEFLQALQFVHDPAW